MPSLKHLKLRISSVKATKKITSAMKMVAASKLRRAQEQADAARPYAERMERLMGAVAAGMRGRDGAFLTANLPPLLVGSGREETHLLVVVTADRGLCGGFNSNIVRAARRRVRELQQDGKTVKLVTIGRKGRDQLRRDCGSLIVDSFEDVGNPRLSFADAAKITELLRNMFADGGFDTCSVLYNRFESVVTQVVTDQQLIPLPLPEVGEAQAAASAGEIPAVIEYEPSDEEVLADLLPHNLSVQVYRALLESSASEQGARMTAMDNATRNAGEMIDALSLEYNRTRQAVITNELIEIISGAEAI